VIYSKGQWLYATSDRMTGCPVCQLCQVVASVQGCAVARGRRRRWWCARCVCSRLNCPWRRKTKYAARRVAYPGIWIPTPQVNPSIQPWWTPRLSVQ